MSDRQAMITGDLGAIADLSLSQTIYETLLKGCNACLARISWLTRLILNGNDLPPLFCFQGLSRIVVLALKRNDRTPAKRLIAAIASPPPDETSGG